MKYKKKKTKSKKEERAVVVQCIMYMVKIDHGTDAMCRIRRANKLIRWSVCGSDVPEYSQSNHGLLKFPLSRYKRAVKHLQATKHRRGIFTDLQRLRDSERYIALNGFLISS